MQQRRGGGKGWRILGVALLVTAFLLLFFGGIATWAWRTGQEKAAEQKRTALEEQLARQLVLAQSDLDAGNYQLALDRLDWILTQAPEYPAAANLRQQAVEGLHKTPFLLPTPTSLPLVAPTPIPTPRVVVAGDEPARRLAAIELGVQAQEWETAVSQLIDFQGMYPNYERWQTDSLLYNAAIQAGLALLKTDRVELGLYYLEVAERLGSLPIEIEDQRLWAEMYLSGLAFYGVNWGVTIGYFRDLCLVAPFYQNSCTLLQEALEAQGDDKARLLDWCPAVTAYDEALYHEYNQELNLKLTNAQELCLLATPTPLPVITTTVTNTVGLLWWGLP